MTIDLADSKILYFLDLDSKISHKTLAKKIGKSPETTLYRISRLRKRGIMLRQHAIVDMSKLGYETYRVYIRWQNMTLQDKEKFYAYLRNKSDVWTTAILHGKWDLAFFVGVKQSSRFQALWSDIETLWKDKIAENKIAIYSPIHNFNKTFFVPELDFRIQRTSGGSVVIKHDEVDEQICREFSPDVTQPLHAIAKKVGVSPETVRKRIKRLETEKVIVGYKIDIDFNRIDLQGYRVDFYLNSTQRNAELFEYLKQNKYFYQVNDSIGGADFETEIVVTSLTHLLNELENIMKRFKDVIRYYEYFGYSGFPTLGFIPD
jgi:DNA-binding Lrp family transcriptional regulator